MPMIMPEGTDKQDGQKPRPRPTPCPTCGLTADNAVVVRSEVTTAATYVCTNGHLNAVLWMEMAA